MTYPITKWIVAFLVVATLAGCSEDAPQRAERPAPVHFESGDECHVCGMAITHFPGPKGQAFTEREQDIRKFCSTKDMFAWFLQPENENRDHTLYVHNMAETHWEHPDDTHLIDARKAFYVVGSSLNGAMGPTLASFATETDAVDFAADHGGEVLSFSDITLEHLNSGMAMHDMAGMHEGHEVRDGAGMVDAHDSGAMAH
ncbi:nitrous oxide reductase accessory protein NosL [Marinobacter daepoensis]|uniref:Nitrous oxide reductase accessory protein NosL n=1 Tax=Marinobacter daepoensis TaxID=262077 RepID=A0ABS3BGU8_9GAMM|nr:nitrous oxide reductase accessory protein NosL [Marinobacter daepoensis]MBN7770879.1 nitrous oxide reductase accessory protein NosL [Marinobacter daepoensis]MBY6078741.1 nitrous oxide reductase accessory protein NosL [Marinobacter daepoensis]